MIQNPAAIKFPIKEPKALSPRITWLRDYYFRGVKRPWNNQYTSWTTGAPWDVQLDELSYYISPDSYLVLQTFRSSLRQVAHTVPLHPDFWKWSLVERRAWFTKEVMVNRLPHELLPGDLIAGGRFNIQTSRCLNKREAKAYDSLILGKKGVRAKAKCFHDHGCGNAGATSGHILPDYARVLSIGWKGIYRDIKESYDRLSRREQKGARGGQLRAMMTSASLPGELSARYASLCRAKARKESDPERKEELLQMARNLERVPWEPAETFWEALQSLWISHMLVMSDENYPGSGLSFGRIDQYLLPFWEGSIRKGMDREFGKELLKCLWIHANNVYDSMMWMGGNQGITSSLGQLINISGLGPNGADMTNDLTYAILEVIDELMPIVEPKPNIRLHRGSPERLLDKVVDMISSCQGAPFLINFDERSMAGLLREARMAGVGHLIHEGNVHDYAAVGCLENTMVGNDRSGTVDVNLNLLKAVEYSLTGGRDLLPCIDLMTGKTGRVRRNGPRTGDPVKFKKWDEFWNAYVRHTKHLVENGVELYEASERIRARYSPTPYLSCLVKGCAEKGRDVTQDGPELRFVTVEGVTFASTVDSLLAVKYLVFDEKLCSMEELIRALRDNWNGHEKLRALAKNRAPKYGRDDDSADAMALHVMNLWTSETWNYKTKSTDRQFRPGMLSGIYWITDAAIMPASPDGRFKGQFLSNAICPSDGADIYGPTANANSIGKALGGKAADGMGDWKDYLNNLPSGASHTMTFNPSLLRDPEHRSKFKAFLRGYAANGGTCLQVNMIDSAMLCEAQKHPQDYRHLLVRVTGYNSYFCSLGRELQDEIIARESHRRY